MPIHGHTKIELTNQTTGEVEVIEKDNIVTNAVTQLFNAFNGTLNLREANANGEYGITNNWQLLESLYGGLLLYDTPLGSDPDTVFAPPEANIVGSGTIYRQNNGSGLQRGGYNKTESKIDLEDGVVTFVYDFATSQANGTIASVCLTHRLGGFFNEAEKTLTSADNACTEVYLTSSLFGQEKLFPGAPGQTDVHLYGRPLYADPETDTMIFASLSGKKLTLRHASALTREVDLFHPIGTTRITKTETFDLSDFLLFTGSYFYYYAAVGYDADADQIYVVSTPGNEQLKTTDKIRVRTYDRKTREAKTYEFTNPTGAVLAGNVGGDRPGVRNTGRVLGGCLYMAGYVANASATAPKVTPFYKIPLGDPSKVESINNHGLMMPMMQDAHDGRIYYYGSKYGAFGAVLNTATNELHAMEAFYNVDQYPYCFVPVLGQPVTPYTVRYSSSSGTNECDMHQGIRRNYLATINDLDTPVTKTADKTMKITYTLRREEN